MMQEEDRIECWWKILRKGKGLLSASYTHRRRQGLPYGLVRQHRREYHREWLPSCCCYFHRHRRNDCWTPAKYELWSTSCRCSLWSGSAPTPKYWLKNVISIFHAGIICKQTYFRSSSRSSVASESPLVGCLSVVGQLLKGSGKELSMGWNL